jgi:anaerobic selenocysteine-containing dehydrogenase
MRTVRSFCRVCTSVCGILVDVDGDDVIAVHGDRDHPFSQGYTCPKGRALPRIHHHHDRLEHPLIRVDGELRPTTWEACLDDLGDRLRAEWTRSATASPKGFTPRSARRRGSAP